jgi:DNA-binding NarL/FixJ family response regulator
LQLNENIKLIHKLESCAGFIPLFKMDKPDVVLMDIDLPGIDGITGVWQIKMNWPEIKVLMLTVFEDVDKIFGAIKAGANGYLLKKDSPQKILDAIDFVYRGESPMNGIIATKVLDYFHKSQDRNSVYFESNLTEREKEILNLLIKGLSYKQIAGDIFISVETLNSHIKNIYRKLNVHSRSELASRLGHV